MTKEPRNVDKWGQLVKVTQAQEPPYGDLEELKLLKSLKVCHMMIYDPNIDLYVKEIEESLSCFYETNPAPNTIEIEKVLYVYLKGLLTMILTPIFLDNLASPMSFWNKE